MHAYAGTCRNLNILMVSNSSTGIQLVLTSATNNFSPRASVNISDHYLPPECGKSNRCNILHFESGEFSYYIIPSIRGFATLSHKADDTDIQTKFISIGEECNPTQTFYDGPAERHNYNIVITCVDLQTQPHGIIYYLQYRFFPNSTGRGSIMRRNYEQLTQPEQIYTPDDMSEVIFVRGQQRCAEYDNLYFIDDAYIVHYPFNAFDPEFIISNNAIQNCPGYKGIEYYGNDALVIRCSNNQAVLYDSCTSTFTYPSPNNIPYPCTNWDNIIYQNGSKLTLQSRNGIHATSLKFPFSELIYGKCVQIGNFSTFIGSSADGEIFITPFSGSTDSKVVNILSGNCFKGSNTCHKPVFSENEQVFGVFDPATYSLVVVNLTQSCSIVNISAPFIPELLSISQGQGAYNCGCREMRPQPFNFTTAALGGSMKEDTIQQSIPLIPVVVAMAAVITAILIVILVIM